MVETVHQTFPAQTQVRTCGWGAGNTNQANNFSILCALANTTTRLMTSYLGGASWWISAVFVDYFYFYNYNHYEYPQDGGAQGESEICEEKSATDILEGAYHQA